MVRSNKSVNSNNCFQTGSAGAMWIYQPSGHLLLSEHHQLCVLWWSQDWKDAWSVGQVWGVNYWYTKHFSGKTSWELFHKVSTAVYNCTYLFGTDTCNFIFFFLQKTKVIKILLKIREKSTNKTILCFFSQRVQHWTQFQTQKVIFY